MYPITVFILNLQITVPCGNAGIYIGKTDAAGRGVWCIYIGNWRHLTANSIIFYDKLVKARMFNRSDGSLGRMTVSGDVDECFTCNRYQAVAELAGDVRLHGILQRDRTVSEVADQQLQRFLQVCGAVMQIVDALSDAVHRLIQCVI